MVNGEITGAPVAEELPSRRELDRRLIALDGTPDKSRLGGKAVLGVSLAAARAAAASNGQPLCQALNANSHVLPVPLVNLINGGRHASNDLDFQEFIILPVGAGSIKTGAPVRGERSAKHNRLIRIAEELGETAVYPGDVFVGPPAVSVGS